MSDLYIRVGESVPEFKLETYDAGKKSFGEFSLSEAKRSGKWTVLFFYPADFTFVCPTELKDLQDKYEELKDIGVEVVSVSTDTKFSHLAWHQNEKLISDLSYIMGADPTGALSKQMGVYDPESGLALRGSFVINPEGILVSSEINFYNVGRNADELLRKMKANEHLAKNPNEACPAKWKPGDKTLIPSEKIVGHVFEALN